MQDMTHDIAMTHILLISNKKKVMSHVLHL